MAMNLVWGLGFEETFLMDRHTTTNNILRRRLPVGNAACSGQRFDVH